MQKKNVFFFLFTNTTGSVPLCFQDLDNKDNYQEWLNIYPETNKNIWQYKQLSWKQKIELWFAANNMLPAAKSFKRMLEWQHKIRYHCL